MHTEKQNFCDEDLSTNNVKGKGIPLQTPTPLKFNIASEKGPPQKETTLPSIIYQGPCQTSGVYMATLTLQTAKTKRALQVAGHPPQSARV